MDENISNVLSIIVSLSQALGGPAKNLLGLFCTAKQAARRRQLQPNLPVSPLLSVITLVTHS